MVRRSVIDQISIDPMTGFPNAIPADSATLMAWGTDAGRPDGDRGPEGPPRWRTSCTQVPLAFGVSGKTTFANDLLRASVLEVGANFFSKDPWALNLGPGRPRGSRTARSRSRAPSTPSQVVVALTFGGDDGPAGGSPKALEEKARCEPGTEGCVVPQDGLPDLEVLDVRTGAWVQFAHLAQNTPYELPDPARWVDAASGEVQVRFVNERQDQISFQFPIRIEGTVR